MTYELANELITAKFPALPVHPDNPNVFQATRDALFYKYPTLSELIEACREKFKRLVYDPAELREAGMTWFACSTKESGHKETGGQTPEEAVANLWLALNKKN